MSCVYKFEPVVHGKEFGGGPCVEPTGFACRSNFEVFLVLLKDLA